MATEPSSFLPYEEPNIITIFTQSAFLLILNVINAIFDKLIFCGLLGQVFVGVAFGTPGAKWLSRDVEGVVVQLGYLGLVLLVYEGGLETKFHALKANLFLSVAVAVTGISIPIALSFTLQSLVGATPLQAFAAGAALCSTSLGTTFTILSSSGLAATRLGTVLSSAAMMDDVVGLVMVQVISNLGGSFSAVTVVRPLAVSVGLAVAVPLVCGFVVKPVTVLFNGVRKSRPRGVVDRCCGGVYTPFVVHTLLLVGFVTGATYAGTSNLFAVYLAGASVSWWDSEVPHFEAVAEGGTPESSSLPNEQRNSSSDKSPENKDAAGSLLETGATESNKVQNEPTATSGTAVYHKYYAAAVQRILKPFFFASIGFAIPITDMFSGPIVWRGIIYTILMLFAKLVTGLWLIRLHTSWPKIRLPKVLRSLVTAPATCFGWMYGKPVKPSTNAHELQNRNNNAVTPQPTTRESPTATATMPTPTPPKINKPLSLYPAAMLGTAMIARGEIGFLIASLAETTGLFASSTTPSNSSSEIYLVVTWAIVLCTIIGPLGVGTLVKRVRKLEGKEDGKSEGESGPLGIWGVD
ncbi:Na(+)/H(+)-K(+) antiporter GerN [Lachnellula suecica]|uniref:Na(+)/H(+)-K(+) antiporter GerN n=1 Tax=Lachnellula suecica TaxID=602035 RepID=A0A8T9CGU1_9HELO|nr:Na(+)/H(+)-K(+) antiporter GerN [Lachnellula suecica]